jgi:antitoxin component of MazEF toxin-antitoxin module
LTARVLFNIVDTIGHWQSNHKAKYKSWGNSSAIRLPAKILAYAGITNNSAVDIQADGRRLVIRLFGRTQGQLLDKLLVQKEGMKELLKTLLAPNSKKKSIT